MGHVKEESRYFLLLLHLARAGTLSLQKNIREQLEEAQGQRLLLKKRIRDTKNISKEDQITYYSSWHYAAAHVLLTVERFQSREALAKRLALSLHRASEILEFLESIGLAKKSGDRFEVGEMHVFLGNDSAMITKHHTNWRVRAISSFDHEEFKEDVHFSSAMTMSIKDAHRIKSLLVKTIAEANQIARDSGAEEGYGVCMDFFRL
jgi:uncharacterized protein (TIGR02147 family)